MHFAFTFFEVVLFQKFAGKTDDEIEFVQYMIDAATGEVFDESGLERDF